MKNRKKTSISETSLNSRTGLSSKSILLTQKNINSDTQKYSMKLIKFILRQIRLFQRINLAV